MMNVVIRTGLALALATGLIGSSAAAQQSQPPQQEQQRAKTPEPVSGELISLDATAKTLVVKTAPDKEMTFSYNDTTEIFGAD
jgi:hypothetical protein